MFIKNKYYFTYYNIINRAKSRQLPLDTKTENHHIIPRSLGGDDSESNLAILTLKEHWICHRLLVKFLIDKTYIRKMYNALYMMAVKDYRQVNARIYEQIKTNVVPWNKGVIGIKGTPCKEKTKDYFRSLYKGKSRPASAIDAMKEGWKKAKENGHRPWNHGISTGIATRSMPCTFISPDGIEYKYSSCKQGCIAHNLPTSKMSNVKTGKLSQYKGWKIKTESNNYGITN